MLGDPKFVVTTALRVLFFLIGLTVVFTTRQPNKTQNKGKKRRNPNIFPA